MQFKAKINDIFIPGSAFTFATFGADTKWRTGCLPGSATSPCVLVSLQQYHNSFSLNEPTIMQLTFRGRPWWMSIKNRKREIAIYTMWTIYWSINILVMVFLNVQESSCHSRVVEWDLWGVPPPLPPKKCELFVFSFVYPPKGLILPLRFCRS